MAPTQVKVLCVGNTLLLYNVALLLGLRFAVPGDAKSPAPKDVQDTINNCLNPSKNVCCATLLTATRTNLYLATSDGLDMEDILCKTNPLAGDLNLQNEASFCDVLEYFHYWVLHGRGFCPHRLIRMDDYPSAVIS